MSTRRSRTCSSRWSDRHAGSRSAPRPVRFRNWVTVVVDGSVREHRLPSLLRNPDIVGMGCRPMQLPALGVSADRVVEVGTPVPTSSGGHPGFRMGRLSPDPPAHESSRRRGVGRHRLVVDDAVQRGGNSSCGSSRTSNQVKPQCMCGPLARPVAPTAPITSPCSTRSPTATSMRLRWMNAEATPWP